MVSEPLYSECAQCGGTGRWQRPPERSGNSLTQFGSQECPGCGGLGMTFSAMGQEVVDIVLRLRRIGRLH